jgi:hypothetical protein
LGIEAAVTPPRARPKPEEVVVVVVVVVVQVVAEFGVVGVDKAVSSVLTPLIEGEVEVEVEVEVTASILIAAGEALV